MLVAVTTEISISLICPSFAITLLVIVRHFLRGARTRSGRQTIFVRQATQQDTDASRLDLRGAADATNGATRIGRVTIPILDEGLGPL
jgi:hypothetical protein